MKIYPLGVLLLAGVAYGQFGNWGSPSNIGPPRNPPPYGKPPSGPGRPGPYSGPPGGGNNYPPPGGNYPPGGGGYSSPQRGDYNDDPIPPMSDGDSSFDSQQLPSKLPILAPNGVVEIYNRVVDDLIRKLEIDLQKKELDPMQVVIRSTPPGPVRVPGYLQKRPFRRPGAALYRSTSPVQPPSGPIPSLLSKKSSVKRGRAGVLPPETRFGDTRPSADGESTSVRGAGKISKGPIEVIDDDEKEILEPTSVSTTTTSTTTSTTTEEAPKVEDLPPIAISSEERGSSEEDVFMKPRSDEFFPEPEEEEEEPKAKKEKKREESEEVEEEAVDQGSDKDVDSLIQHYQSKNSKTKDRYSGKKKNQKPVVVDPSSDSDIAGTSMEGPAEESKPSEKERKSSKKDKPKKEAPPQQSEESDDDDEDDDEPESRDDHEHEDFDGPPEAGTGGGKRPQGGYYAQSGPPAVPAKPNAELNGLSRIRRASDVSVSVDARSAVITARLLVGPINVVINESQEPMEKNVKATIPELEAEILLMERHGVVFLQRFTLDRAYGQDVEISIPKSKKTKEKKNSVPPNDPSHPMNVETRRQTKMAAHISMEVVKLLRSGNLRVQLMRRATAAMSSLKLPIKKAKNKKGKKEKGKRHD